MASLLQISDKSSAGGMQDRDATGTVLVHCGTRTSLFIDSVPDLCPANETFHKYYCLCARSAPQMEKVSRENRSMGLQRNISRHRLHNQQCKTKIKNRNDVQLGHHQKNWDK